MCFTWILNLALRRATLPGCHKYQLTSLDCNSAVMTNFNDPDAITRDYCAYTFSAVLRS